MTKRIHSGIVAGQVSEGYKLEHGYVIPKEWKVVHFNECFHRLTQKNTENNQNVLTISAQQGLISQLDYYNTLYASEDKTGYFLLQKGNFAYNKSYSADYAYGAIKQLEKYDKGIVSPLYICFSANEGTNTDFYRQYFEAGMFNREIYKIAQEGARNHGLLNVSTPEFFSAALVFPPVDEQKKIAEILSCCDRVIELKQQLIAELQWLKSGFLQAMFPAKGHSEPVIRFPEFSDAWEQRKLSDVAGVYDGVHQTPDYQDEGIMFLSVENIATMTSEKYISEEAYERDYKVRPEKGDILMTRIGDVGTPNVVETDEKLAYYVSLALLKPKGIDSYFFNNAIQSSAFQHGLRERTLLTAIPMKINKDEIGKVDISFPTDVNEQRKIGESFKQLDNLITLHQRELEETKKKKKSLAKLLLTGSVRVPT